MPESEFLGKEALYSFSFNRMYDSVAMYTERETWSYKQLYFTSSKIASIIGKRTLIFILCTNTPESIAGYVACINNKIVPAMIDAHLDVELLSNLVNTYKPAYLWMPQNCKKDFQEYSTVFSLGDYILLATGESAYSLHDNLALLMTTSGSTGSPKFVRLSYENIRSNTESIIKYLGINASECSITNLPMHYVYGLSIINTHLYAGGSLVVTDKNFFFKEFWQMFTEHKVTNFGGVPYTFEMLRRLRFFSKELPDLRTITQAGGKLDPELHKKFAEYANKYGKRFIVMYGAAEATARMGYLPAEYSLRKCGSMGIAIPGGSFTLEDENGKKIEEIDTEGELVYRGYNVMMGYAECGEDLSRGDDMKGVLRTGDLAKRDREGFYTIVGRKKRFLKMYGKRTNLAEVEHLLRQHFCISEVACGGIDDCLYVFIIEDIPDEEIIKYLSKKIGFPRSAFCVKHIDEIPKNSSGKTLYRELVHYYNI